MANTSSTFSRRKFFITGTLASCAVLLNSCVKRRANVYPSDKRVAVGEGDTGMLNYIQAIEQLLSDFFDSVIGVRYKGMTDEEYGMFTEIMQHDIIHREFAKKILEDHPTEEFVTNLSSIDFTSKDDVLKHAQIFKNLSVAAYNHVVHESLRPVYLEIVVSIVSVEARHSAYITNLINSGEYISSEVKDTYGMEINMPIQEVVEVLNKYIPRKLNADNYK